MKLAIVIITYNAKKWFNLSIGSCLKYAPSVPLYVVDNNSPDNTASLIENEYPTVYLIKSANNTGFAAGNNIGLKQALSAGAEAVLLLNQDAEITIGTLDNLQAYLETNPKVAAVQPVILLPDGTVNSIGNSFHYLGFAEAMGNGLSLAKAWSEIYGQAESAEPPYISGAAVLLRSAALRQAGLFDEDLFMYHEDLELSLRFRLSGWHLGIIKNSLAIHHYQPERSKRQIYFMERNRYLVWLSYFKPATLVCLFLPAVMAEFVMLLTALINGWLGAKLRTWNYLLSPSARDYLLQKKRQLKTFKPYRDRTLLRVASSRLSWQGDIWYMQIFNLVSRLAWRLIFPFVRW
ncbi:MAG: glycosyltransferase family 2 protein [Candidatus Kerfeldbacteria bacterium]|nr:glycosyltransferase family 2 protein [Candidatus Kerfeldbacteria bacterium]